MLPWTAAVREGQIESRRLATDEAVIRAILGRSPSSVLDIGCGEGWLTRELARRSIETVGVDAIPALIAEARSAGSGEFHVVTHEEIAAGKFTASVDLAVCNFSLFGKASVEGLFSVCPSLLKPGGAFVVQTLHPVVACGDYPYTDGWREGSWAGFSSEFTDPAPWYLRTLENWVRLFITNGFRLVDVQEPVHPHTQKPASVIFVGVID